MFLRVGNTLLDTDKITAVFEDKDNADKWAVLFDNGEKMILDKDEARELWRHFEPEPSWKG